MNPFLKYVLFQVPGWLLVGFLLVWLWPITGLDAWIAVLGYAVFVAKDFVLWPWLRPGYESNVPTGARRLVGARAVTRGRLDPRGYVRVGGELWRAEILPGGAPLPPGTEVRIEAAEGLTLFVSPVEDAPSALAEPPG